MKSFVACVSVFLVLACMLIADYSHAQQCVNGKCQYPVLGAPVRAVKAVVSPLGFNTQLTDGSVATMAVVSPLPAAPSDLSAVQSHPEFYDVVTSVAVSSPVTVYAAPMHSHGADQVRRGMARGVAKHAVGLTKAVAKKSVCAVVKATGHCRRK